jgi:hypothetical protein
MVRKWRGGSDGTNTALDRAFSIFLSLFVEVLYAMDQLIRARERQCGREREREGCRMDGITVTAVIVTNSAVNSSDSLV